MPVYPGDPPVSLEPVHAAGPQSAAVSLLRLGTHTGTHVDPPAHLYPGGATVDELSLDVLVGQATVVDASGTGAIGLPEVQALLAPGCVRLLLRTRGAGPAGDAAERWLTEAAARCLVAAGIHLVGIDTLSVDPLDRPDLPAHRVLLGAGVVILEGLDLRGVSPGDYTLLCLPLRVAGGDGAPARAVLLAQG